MARSIRLSVLTHPPTCICYPPRPLNILTYRLLRTKYCQDYPPKALPSSGHVLNKFARQYTILAAQVTVLYSSMEVNGNHHDETSRGQ